MNSVVSCNPPLLVLLVMTQVSPPTNEITDREGLIEALNQIAELEHQFMCMYLYAALSLKKGPDEFCDKAKFEAVRRWTSKIYMMARQEMEHLSLVNSMLAAIGAPPYFSRENIPKISQKLDTETEIPPIPKAVASASPQVLANHNIVEYSEKSETPTTRYESATETPCEFPFIFEPFDLKSARRYACMESPKLCHLLNLPKELQNDVKKWCFNKCDDYSWPQGLDKETFQEEAGAGTIEKLYKDLREGFEEVAKNDKSLFVSSTNQHQVEVLSQYNVYIFPVTDLTSALNAIDLIIKQGEGLINAPPDFNSHFQNFYDIAKEYEGLTDGDNNNKFAILPVPSNPKQENIQNEFTKKIFDLFNYSYVTLLYVLTGLYGWYTPASKETNYPHLSAALRNIAFAPTMTMLVRTLGEVLVQLPLDKDASKVAAPNFHIPSDDDEKLQICYQNDWQSEEKYSCYTDIGFYLKRFEKIEEDLKNLKDQESLVKEQLKYIHENIYRLTGNLRKVYQTGVYSNFRSFS